MTQISGSQVTKMNDSQRSFWPREILSDVKRIPLFWWRALIRWRLRLLTWNCLLVVMAVSAVAQLPLRQKGILKTWMCYPANSIPLFHIGVCLLWKSLKFQACCYNDCATLQEKLKTSNQEFWKSIPLYKPFIFILGFLGKEQYITYSEVKMASSSLPLILGNLKP